MIKETSGVRERILRTMLWEITVFWSIKYRYHCIEARIPHLKGISPTDTERKIKMLGTVSAILLPRFFQNVSISALSLQKTTGFLFSPVCTHRLLDTFLNHFFLLIFKSSMKKFSTLALQHYLHWMQQKWVAMNSVSSQK